MKKGKRAIYHYEFNLHLLTVVFAIPNFTKASMYRLPMLKLSNAFIGSPTCTPYNSLWFGARNVSIDNCDLTPLNPILIEVHHRKMYIVYNEMCCICHVKTDNI